MSEAKEAILRRIRNALSDAPDGEQPADVTVPRAYRRKGDKTEAEIAALFADRVGDYEATVRQISNEYIPKVISEACRKQNVNNLVIPPGFPEEWLPGSIHAIYDRREAPLSHYELDASDGVITTCALAVAQTGTIILDAGEGQGRRALSLLPDYHLCIVREKQIVEIIPEAFAYFAKPVQEEGRPVTFISGPSATSDIELRRVEGVHGPRRLEVLIVED